jgi:hypothetical protein
MSSSIFWRILIGVLFFVLLTLLLPPLFRVLGFALTGDVELIVRVCLAALVVFYIITGRPSIG